MTESQNSPTDDGEVFDDAADGELVARCYTGEAAQALADAWWTRVEWSEQFADDGLPPVKCPECGYVIDDPDIGATLCPKHDDAVVMKEVSEA